MSALYQESGKRHFFYGGAIRGGKSYVSLCLLASAAYIFPNSRWHVFRRDLPALLATAIPSMEKIIGKDKNWRWHRDKSNYYLECQPNGSRIYFKGENPLQDPFCNDLLGLETNGILFEQIEEISQRFWQLALSRVGSWYCPGMPAAVSLATFNPTQQWVKQIIYEPYTEGKLDESFFYMNALPSDNAYVTQEQWKAWTKLEEHYRKQYIEGDWTDYGARDNLWAFAYDPALHLAPEEMLPDRRHWLILSFDFNRNPICCSIIQDIEGQVRVIETIKLANSDIHELCRVVQERYPGFVYYVTGDATGHSHTALMGDRLSYYLIIKSRLSLKNNQLKVPFANPPLADNQVLVNTLLAHGDVKINAGKAAALAYDLAHVKMNPDGTIVKRNRLDPAQQADALDTFRYFCNVFRENWAKGRFLNL